jgi:DNA-binding CsgD family transcriptional regulator
VSGIDDSTFQRLIAQIYDAALEPERWSAFLAAFADACGAGAVMHVQDPTATGAHICAYAGLDPAFGRIYETHYSKIRPWLPKLAKLPVGKVYPLFALIDESDYRKCVVYNECLTHADVHYQLGSVLRLDGKVHTAIAVTRPLRAGDFTAREFMLAARLMPHLQRALQIHWRLVAGRVQHEALLRGLDGLGMGVILAESDGRILFANGIAETILRRGDGLGARQKRLHAATPAVTDELHRRIHQAACTGAKLAQHTGGALSLPRLGGGTMSLLVCPFPIDPGPVVGLALPTALIFLADPNDRTPMRQSDLRSFYGLTAAEAKLTAALLGGFSVGEYAEASGISRATVKTQLHHVFRKTGQSRQSDLVRHILSNPVLHLASGEW